MEIIMGIIFIAAGVLLPAAGYFNKVGQFGFGTESGLRLGRATSRVMAIVAGPIFLATGIVLLVNHTGR